MKQARYEARTNGACLWITVERGIAVEAESPTHPCFLPNFLGQRWETLRPKLEGEGFRITEGC